MNALRWVEEGSSVNIHKRLNYIYEKKMNHDESERVDSRSHLITNMNRLRGIDSCPLAGPEVNFRSGFLDPFLAADENWIKHWEDLEGVECLDCAQGGAVRDHRIQREGGRSRSAASRSHDQCRKDPDDNGL